MKYEIKPLNKEELKETLELVKNVFDEFEAPDYTNLGIESFYEFANYENVSDMLGKTLKILVAKYNKKIVGMIAYRDYSHIAMLFVEKKYHYNGIAKNLVLNLIDDCKKQNKNLEYITVNSSPYAVEFYQKMGFKKLEDEKEVDGIRFTPMRYKIVKKDELELVFPTKEYKKQVEEYCQEFFDNGENEISGDGELDEIKDFDKWLLKIQNDLSEETVEQNRVPATMYLTIRKSDNKIVGNIQIRHRLNDFLLKCGGHIGDSVRPSERRKGYATEQIRLALKKCKELGIGNVLITCDKTNIGSAKSIINNGGILENEINVDGIVKQRYWISLKKRYADRSFGGRADMTIFKTKSINEDDFKGDVCYYNFIDVNEKMIIPKGLCIMNTGYKWLEFYDYSSKVKLSAIYDEYEKIVEWYFDIARKIGKENGTPYEDDLYLDVVVTPAGEIILLDEDELKDAYEKLEVSQKEYDMAYSEARNLMKKLENNVDKLKMFTNKYLDVMKKFDKNR